MDLKHFYYKPIESDHYILFCTTGVDHIFNKITLDTYT